MREVTLSVAKPPRHNNRYLQCAVEVVYLLSTLRPECKLKSKSGFDSKLLNLLENKSRLRLCRMSLTWSVTNEGVTFARVWHFLNGYQAQRFFPTYGEVSA